jgi:hypothetical protein
MKISELIEELQELLNEEGDLEVYEELMDSGENTGMWYTISPVVRNKKEVKIREGYGDLPDKFISLE